MPPSLPPLNALRAFESAARCLSFKQAAEELHVTPAAVSQQIKALEHYLGLPLFRRANRVLQLTPAAQAGLPKVQEGFACLAEAMEQFRARAKSPMLTISVAPSLAAKWLVPRLHRFAAVHPDIDMRISASMALVDGRSRAALADFRRDGIDLAIRFGRGKYPGFQVDKLFSVAIVPMCSPRLLEGEYPLREPEDLRHHVLLHDDTLSLDDRRPDWGMWLKAAGVRQQVDANRGQHFSHTALA
jgi:LysR family glycine cleavage system transcriptional activator